MLQTSCNGKSRSVTPSSRSRHLLNEQLLSSMQQLDIPLNVQERVMHLPTKQKRSMLELYSRQQCNPHHMHHHHHNGHQRKPSVDPLDAQLLHRMNELYVPKHIQSQIITLPKQKKRILLAKYNHSPPAPACAPSKFHKSRQPQLHHPPHRLSSSTSNRDSFESPPAAFHETAPSKWSNASSPEITAQCTQTSLFVNRDIKSHRKRSNVVLPSPLHRMQTLKQKEFVQILSNQKQLQLPHAHPRRRGHRHSRRHSDSSLHAISEHKPRGKHKANSVENSLCKFQSDSISNINSSSHSRRNSLSISITDSQSHTFSPDTHTKYLHDELFQIMDNMGNFELVSNPNPSGTPQTQQTQQTMLIHPEIDSITISQIHELEDTEDEQDEDDFDDEKLEMCLRCLKRVCVAEDKYTKCQFHAFQSEAPGFSNVGYFTARNHELWQARDFNFVCCARRCHGAFQADTSQDNGCRVVYSHLFASELDQRAYREDSHEPLAQIEGDSLLMSMSNGVPHHTLHSNKLCGVSRDVSFVDRKHGHSKICRSQDQNEYAYEDEEEEEVRVHVVGLCGKWKVFVYREESNRLCLICDVHITKHSKRGRIEGKLMSMNVMEQDEHEESKDGGFYFGHLNAEQLVLTYNGSYSASYVLNVAEYELEGEWISSLHSKGTCQWFKMQKLLLP